MGNDSLKNEKNLYNKFLGVLTKKGNSTKAKSILDKTFTIVSKKTGSFKEIILFKLFICLNTFVEVKKVKIKRRSFLIPFSMNLERRSYLILRWLMQAIKKKTKKSSFVVMLSNEILTVISGATTDSKKLRKLNVSQAISNRSNIHYRW
jgi:ribosomal protein S7